MKLQHHGCPHPYMALPMYVTAIYRERCITCGQWWKVTRSYGSYVAVRIFPLLPNIKHMRWARKTKKKLKLEEKARKAS